MKVRQFAHGSPREDELRQWSATRDEVATRIHSPLPAIADVQSLAGLGRLPREGRRPGCDAQASSVPVVRFGSRSDPPGRLWIVIRWLVELWLPRMPVAVTRS